ncbi:hypothetical protein BC831DRAFT_443972 [Entophlyctis helioformis]|nr:hypothetical protein BC831DRAFT_443972 [Entophlyctis helioformis]
MGCGQSQLYSDVPYTATGPGQSSGQPPDTLPTSTPASPNTMTRRKTERARSASKTPRASPMAQDTHMARLGNTPDGTESIDADRRYTSLADSYYVNASTGSLIQIHTHRSPSQRLHVVGMPASSSIDSSLANIAKGSDDNNASVGGPLDAIAAKDTLSNKAVRSTTKRVLSGSHDALQGSREKSSGALGSSPSSDGLNHSIAGTSVSNKTSNMLGVPRPMMDAIRSRSLSNVIPVNRLPSLLAPSQGNGQQPKQKSQWTLKLQKQQPSPPPLPLQSSPPDQPAATAATAAATANHMTDSPTQVAANTNQLPPLPTATSPQKRIGIHHPPPSPPRASPKLGGNMRRSTSPDPLKPFDRVPPLIEPLPPIPTPVLSVVNASPASARSSTVEEVFAEDKGDPDEVEPSPDALSDALEKLDVGADVDVDMDMARDVVDEVDIDDNELDTTGGVLLGSGVDTGVRMELPVIFSASGSQSVDEMAQQEVAFDGLVVGSRIAVASSLDEPSKDAGSGSGSGSGSVNATAVTTATSGTTALISKSSTVKSTGESADGGAQAGKTIESLEMLLSADETLRPSRHISVKSNRDGVSIRSDDTTVSAVDAKTDDAAEALAQNDQQQAQKQLQEQPQPQQQDIKHNMDDMSRSNATSAGLPDLDTTMDGVGFQAGNVPSSLLLSMSISSIAQSRPIPAIDPLPVSAPLDVDAPADDRVDPDAARNDPGIAKSDADAAVSQAQQPADASLSQASVAVQGDPSQPKDVSGALADTAPSVSQSHSQLHGPSQQDGTHNAETADPQPPQLPSSQDQLDDQASLPSSPSIPADLSATKDAQAPQPSSQPGQPVQINPPIAASTSIPQLHDQQSTPPSQPSDVSVLSHDPSAASLKRPHTYTDRPPQSSGDSKPKTPEQPSMNLPKDDRVFSASLSSLVTIPVGATRDKLGTAELGTHGGGGGSVSTSTGDAETGGFLSNP